MNDLDSNKIILSSWYEEKDIVKEIKIMLRFDQNSKGFGPPELHHDIYNRLISKRIASHVE